MNLWRRAATGKNQGNDGESSEFHLNTTEYALPAARQPGPIRAGIAIAIASLDRAAQVYMHHAQPARRRRDVILRRINGPEMGNVNSLPFADHAAWKLLG